ncbi:MAG TPA: hypothetical protein VF119_10395, partial [Candidatus Limnocylindrales bacterium]
MTRALGILGAILLSTLILVPFAIAADATTSNGRVLIAIDGDVTVPAGESAEAVIVVSGTATILGAVDTVVAVDGTVDLQGAAVDTVVAITSPVSVGAGTTVGGDVLTLDSDVTTADAATVAGEVRDLTFQFVALGALLAPAFLLFFVGMALVSVVAALVLAGIAARQVRAAEGLIVHEPGQVLLVGIAGLVAPLIVAIALMITVIGAPLGIAILLFAWPAVAYIGYLVAGIFVGEFVLTRMQPGVVRERPYL